MSVLFLPPSAGAASVPDATETVSGKIRIATSAEATAGTNDVTAMTPAKTKSVVDAAVVGGVTYQGTFDASAPADLSNATKGDLYIISVAGTYQGQTWAVGDHLLINADMGGTLDPAKIDKVDNTDSVTSVAGRTGAVTLSTADISGLATVASTGAYSDLSGTPTLGTAAAEDVGTAAGNVVQLNGSAQLPAVDGSLLTNISASVAALDDVGDVNITSVSDGQALVYDSGASEWVNGSAGAVVYQSFTSSGSFAINTKDLHVVRVAGTGINVALSASTGTGSGLVLVSVLGTGNTLSGVTFRRNGESASGGVTTLPLNDGERRLFYIESNALFYEVNATLLDRLAGVSITSPSNGEALIYNSTSGDWENGTVSASVAALNDIGDVSAAAPSNTNVIKYNSTSGDWESGAVAYSEVTGTPTNVSTFTNDAGYLTEAQTVVLQYNSTTTATAVGSKDLHVYRLYGAGGFTLTVSATAANGLVEINNISASACTISGPTFRRNGEGVTGGVTSITVEAGERRVFYLETVSTWLEMNATLLDRLAGVSITSPANGEALIYNSTSGDWENGTVSASVAALNDIGDVSAAAPSNTNVIKYNSTSGDWESGAVAYSEVTGTPTLATVATTGAYSDLSGTPTLGTAAALDVGTSANNIVQLDGSGLLPAVDGSQLTNLPSASTPSVTSATPGATYTISTSTGIEEAYLLTPSAACAVTIPTASSAGSGYKYQVKNLSANTVTISPSSGTIDGSASFDLSVQYATVTLLSDGSNWFVI